MAHSLPTQVFPARQLVTDPAELITFEVDAGFDRGNPAAVFYPESVGDVCTIVRWAYEARVPLVARGAGTGLSGGAVADHGGVIVNFARMNRIVELDGAGRNAVVEPGVVNLHLDSAAKTAGLYFPPDPSSGRSALLGGNVAENSGGPHCFKYGVTTNYVTGLEAVLASGAVVRLGGQAFDYPALDLCGLLVGSEGTLGLITQISVRLIRNPPAVKTMMASFAADEAAGAAVSAIIAAGLMPATLEMMDRKVMGIIEDYMHIGLPVDAAAALIVEVDGYATGLDSQMEEIAGILLANGGYDLRSARSEAERQQIWYGRKSAAGAFARLSPNFYLVDVTVPRSFLAQTLGAVNAICDRYGLQTGHVFHAGDGNLHPCILCDARDADLMQRTLQACDEIVALCVSHDGSITGEHGVGIEKRRYMATMYSAAELAALQEIKLAFDPAGLLNPGKVLPDELPEPVYTAPLAVTTDTVAPRSTEETAAVLAGCTAVGRRVRIVSHVEQVGNSLYQVHAERVGNSLYNGALLLSTEELQGIHKFAPDDLYVTAGSGMPFSALAEFLAGHGFQAPLAAPWPDATIGGLLAQNLNAPLRMRYGGWRDNVLAVKVALPDGRVIRAGRPVVKNVAGYDLAKLFVGSQGMLGVMTEVTLKLTPLPRLRQTLRVAAEHPLQGIRWAQATAPCWLMAAGVVMQCDSAARCTLTFTLEGLPADVRAEADAIRSALRLAGAPAVEEGDVHTATELWCSHLGAGGNDLLVRAGVPPQHLALYWQMLTAEARAGGDWFVDVPSGLLFGRRAGGGTVESAIGWVAQVREPALALRGYAVVQDGPAQVLAASDRWGYHADGAEIVAAIKRRWDPAGVLVL